MRDGAQSEESVTVPSQSKAVTLTQTGGERPERPNRQLGSKTGCKQPACGTDHPWGRWGKGAEMGWPCHLPEEGCLTHCEERRWQKGYLWAPLKRREEEIRHSVLASSSRDEFRPARGERRPFHPSAVHLLAPAGTVCAALSPGAAGRH